MRCVWVLGLGLLAAGCAGAPGGTPSAAADAPMGATRVMQGTPDMVAPALIAEMAERQYFLTEQTATYLAFDRPIDNAALWAPLGGTPEALPRARVVMTLTPAGNQTSVSADMVIVAARGTAHEAVASGEKLAGIDPRMDRILDGASQTVMAEARSAHQLALAAER